MTLEARLREPYWHIRKEDLRLHSARDADPPFESRDVVLRRDYDALLRRLSELEQAQTDLRAIQSWFSQRPWVGSPDSGSFGGGAYTPAERALGYGTYRDPRFLPAALSGVGGQE